MKSIRESNCTSNTKIINLSLITALALFFITSSLSGCFRYVPSRAELQNDSTEEELSLAGEKLGGPEEFNSHEAKLEERLKSFLEERKNAASISGDNGHTLGPGDIVQVDVFGFPDLTATSTVAGDGTLTLSYLAPIPVTGLTAAQLQEKLKSSYSTYVKTPKVRVDIKNHRSSSVSIMGAVAKPGIYPLAGNENNLISLLSLAGGRTDRAGHRLAIIPAKVGKNNIDGTRQALDGDTNSGVEIDYSDLVGTVNKRPLEIILIPGDTVVVPEAGSFKVSGEVTKPGSFPLTSKTSVLGAIAAAAGLTYSADVSQVEIIRDVGGGKRASLILDIEKIARTGQSDIVLRDSDIVTVPSHPGLYRTRQVGEFISGFFRLNSQVRP